MSGPVDRRLVAVAGTCALLAGVAAWAALREEAPPRADAWPTEQELDSLESYLAPSEPAPRVDDYAVFVPAAPPPPRAEPAPEAVQLPPVERRLSAILILGGRPLAIIDDQQVRPGDPLSGGGRVLSIETDRVIIQEAGGARRTLRLSAG